MSDLPDIAAATASAHGMFEPASPLLAMVSGGADSVSLLRWLAGGGAKGAPLSVLHVNHLLREGAADEDALFVEQLCEHLGVPCRVVRYDVAAYAREAGLNLEDAGRRVRYRFAEEELDARCAAAGADPARGRILTAHTQDDRIETMLMRLSQGTGPAGLISPSYTRGRLVRPLLDCTRRDVVAYLTALGQPWREDATNADITRLRARVRAELVPLLRDLNPRFGEAATRTMTLLGDEDALLDDMARALVEECVTVAADADELRIDSAEAEGLPRPLARRMLRNALFETFPESSRLEFDHLEALVDGLADPGFARDLPGGLRAFAEYGTLIISRNAGTIEPLAPSMLSVPGTVDLGDAGVITAQPAGLDGLDADPKSALIDAAAIRDGLVIDSVRPGDRMRPLGMDGSRKLQDVLTDAKVPARSRLHIPIVRDGERIVWVAGVRMSEEYRIAPGSARAVLLKWTPRSKKRETST